MMTFPELQSGAVMQYPATRTTSHSTQVVRFLDGTEQRFRLAGTAPRSWKVELAMLNEQETANLMDFVAAAQGSLGGFAFTDPVDGVSYPACYLAGDSLTAIYRDSGRADTSLVICEAVTV